MMPLFAYVGPVAAAVHREPNPAFVAHARPRDEKVMLRLAGDRAVLADGLVVGHGAGAFAVVRAEAGKYDVVHVASGLRAWRASSYLDALRDATFLAWLGAWEIWTDRPGARPTPPAVTAYLAAEKGPRDLSDGPNAILTLR